MKILIGCEESQVVTMAFRKLGHETYSCDLLPTRGNQSYHLQMDIFEALYLGEETYRGVEFSELSALEKENVNHGIIDEDVVEWDLIILHPDCTAMAVSGNRWYGNGMPKNEKRLSAIEWTTRLWREAKNRCNMVALENPVSVIFKHLGLCEQGCLQYIQPWMFGHGETKKTGLALYGLPELKPTNIVDGREQRIWKMPPSVDRKRDRSETYQGIAGAMADQWGNLS